MNARSILTKWRRSRAGHRFCWAMIFLLGISLLTGCDYGPRGRTPLPPCTADQLLAPTNLSPGGERIIASRSPDLNTLTWEYAGDCAPSTFRVQVYIPAAVYPMGGYYADLDGSARSYSIGPLDAGRMYTWKVTAMSGPDLGPSSRTEVFFTGPVCSSAGRASYQAPILLRPLNGEVVSTRLSIHVPGGPDFASVSVPMEWDDPTTCLPPGGYTVEVSQDPTFRRDDAWASIISAYNSTTADFFISPGTEWHDCERCYWRVLTGWPWTTVGGTPEAPYARVYAISEVWSFVINTTGIICPPDLGPVITPILPFIVPTEATPMLETPLAGVLRPANCRAGPGMDYPVVDILDQGTSLPINGRNQQGTWWQVLDAHNQLNCWLAGGLIDIRGETGVVPVLAVAPPVSTDTPVPKSGRVDCSQYNSITCLQHANGCIWDANTMPNGRCVNR